MPARAKVTKEMIVDAAFAVARETGAENINARTVSERLHCSTQPVMYHFATIEELKRTVYAKADLYHSEYLMDHEEPAKRVLHARDRDELYPLCHRRAAPVPLPVSSRTYLSGKTLLELIDAEELSPGPFGNAGSLGDRSWSRRKRSF